MLERSNILVILAFFAIVVLLGVNFVAVKFSNQELPPHWGAAMRFFIASALLFTVAKLKNFPMPKGKELYGAAIYGLTTFGITYALLYWALLSVSSGMASVMFAAIPLFTLMIASSIGLERLTMKGIMGSLIVIGGILFIFNDQLQFDVPLLPLLGILLAVIIAAISGIIVKYFPKIHPVSMNAVGMGVGVLVLLISSLIFGETPTFPTLTSTYIALAWLITSSISAFVLMVWLINKWNASRASYTMVVTPLVTLVVASIFLGETITTSFLIGSLLVLMGVYVGALSPSKK